MNSRNQEFLSDTVPLAAGGEDRESMQWGASPINNDKFRREQVTIAADSAKKLAEINDRWTDEYADIPTLVHRMSSSDGEDSDTD